MLALALLVSLATADAVPEDAFPEDVVVPTPTEAIGIQQIYAVRDGKLWEKRHPQKGGTGAWVPFGGTGTPPGSTRPVVAVFADEVSHFTVVTDDGLMHHHENGAWDSLWGLPSLPVGRASLALPAPLAQLRAGTVAYSMRRDHALYYEDIRGQQFFWGDVGCTSLFVRHPRDETRILFADPWVPPDWSREVCGPERGGVKLASIAASGSVLFVVANNGEMWTRFDDYDHDGGTPLFHYSYDPAAPRQDRKGTDPASAIQVRHLPPLDWQAQPRIALEGGARISRRIAIVQTGVGNDARELRVIGDDAAAVRGLYTKQLGDAVWRFTPATPATASTTGGLVVGDDEWLDARADSRQAPRATSMRGALTGPRSLGHVTARTDDFSFHCSPFSLVVTVDGADVTLVAHAVDAWTIFTHDNAVDDESAPRLLKITLALAPGQALAPPVRARVDEVFRGQLGAAFAFVGVANQHELVIAPLGYPVTAARSRWQLVLRAHDHERARRHVTLRPASALAARLEGEGTGACAALDAVRAQRADIERRLALFSSLEVGLPMGLGVADAATIATTTRYTLEVMRWLTALELHVPAVAGAPSLAYERWLAGSRRDFDDVVDRLDRACAP